MTPSKRLIRLHNENRTHLGTVELMREPTQIDIISRAIVKDLTVILVVVLIAAAIFTWSFI